MNRQQLRCLRVFLALAVLLLGFGSARDAHAINNMRLCARFTTSYHDIRSGQDYLINSVEPATRHYAEVHTGFSNQPPVWTGHLTDTFVGSNLYACTPWLPIGPFSQHTLWVTNLVLVAPHKLIIVYPNQSSGSQWHTQTFSTPANPIGDSEFNATFAGTPSDHVSLVATRVGPSFIPNTSSDIYYTTYADVPAPGLSQTVGGTVYIGSITVNGVTDKDAYWRSVVGHEMSHQVAHFMWGDWANPYDVNTSSLPACNCDQVEVVGDQKHCLNSLEGQSAARTEAWGHSFSAQMVNLPTDSTAPFGYYKRVYDPQANETCVAGHPQVRCPPVTADAVLHFNWMEGYCNTANAGIEVDWFAFFYQLSNKTPDRWSPGTFWNVFYTECPAGGCNVTWSSLVTAATTFLGPTNPKTLYMVNTAGDQNGVNHL
jgi:hypothetical protein